MVDHIKLYEIAATAKNFEMFKAKYGKDVSDEQLKNIFDRFNKQQSRLQVKDIFKYASLKDLTSALETKSGKEVEKSIKTSEANILVDNEKMMIVEPLSMAASLKYGAHTKWCTTYSDPEQNKFEEYFSKVTLVYFIDKINNTKYAIAYDKKNPKVVEAFDEKDKSIDFSNVLKLFSVTLEEISSKTISPEQKIKLNQYNFRKEIEKQIVGDVINGNINLFNKKLTKITDIFDFSKYKVVGNFHCGNNQLTSLVGAPREVGGNFVCDENKLTSLKGSPEKVGKNFHCSKNQLTTLEGSPEKVGLSFVCNNNQLTSLVGAPKEVVETFNCARNQLTSLKGSPQKVGMTFYCDYNQLTSLVGAPVEVGKTFSCERNKLTSLVGAPEKVGTDFYCGYNQLTSLVGVPKKVGGYFNCRENPTKFSKEDIQKAMKGEVSEIFIQKENNMDKIQQEKDMKNNLKYRDFYPELKEYNVGTSGGYGGGAMAGGAVAPMNWAGTQSSPQTSRRLKDYPASRRYTYMQGNTVIGSFLYDTITRDDLTHEKFTPDEMFAGFRAEMKKMEYPDKDVARPIIIKNLESDPKYYSDLKQYFNSDK
jgi:hypothetical protein